MQSFPAGDHDPLALLIGAFPLRISCPVRLGARSLKERAMFARGTTLLRLSGWCSTIQATVAFEPDQGGQCNSRQARINAAVAYQRSASKMTGRVICGSSARSWVMPTSMAVRWKRQNWGTKAHFRKRAALNSLLGLGGGNQQCSQSCKPLTECLPLLGKRYSFS